MSVEVLQELERSQHQFRQKLDPTRGCLSLGRVEVFRPPLDLLHRVLDRDLGRTVVGEGGSEQRVVLRFDRSSLKQG